VTKTNGKMIFKVVMSMVEKSKVQNIVVLAHTMEEI
jgi:hypothetical protein